LSNMMGEGGGAGGGGLTTIIFLPNHPHPYPPSVHVWPLSMFY
jgi:hypothetical protein